MAIHIGRFLTYFGLSREQAQMQQRLTQALAVQQSQDGDTLTQTEYLYESSLGEVEFRKGYLQAAITRFSRLLARIEAQPERAPLGPGSFEHATTLTRLGRCFKGSGVLSTAEQMDRRAIDMIEMLVKQDPENSNRLELLGGVLVDLGEVLRKQGRYADAKAAHEQALQISEQTGNLHGQAISQGLLGAVALEQGAYVEAQQRTQQALATFQRLGEPAREAVHWHQLGMVAQKQRNWLEAERCYRKSLTLKEQFGDLVSATTTYNQLGQIAAETGRFEEAKGWFQRALILCEQTDATSEDYARYLSNLARLLTQEVETGHAQDASAQLAEAQRYIEQALVISKKLSSPDIWKGYGVLAEIANRQGRIEAAQDYRRREQEAFAAFAGNRFQIDQHFGSLLPLLAAAQDDLEVRAQIEKSLPLLEEKGWYISKALHRMWAGERDWPALVDRLGNGSALLILRALETLAAPTDKAARPPEEQVPETPQETTEK
jgi:tetratricopeptide (TPR) repeat protein